MRTRNRILLLSASLALAASAHAQPDPHPVYRVVWLDGAPAISQFDGVILREDGKVLLTAQSGPHLGGVGEPWSALPTLNDTDITKINASGQLCGFKDSMPFICSPSAMGGYDPIQFLPTGSFSSFFVDIHSLDIADDGTVVGAGYGTGERALIWAPGATEPQALASPDPDLVPVQAQSISPSGEYVVGNAIRLPPNPFTRKFVATGVADATQLGNVLDDLLVHDFRGVTDQGRVLVDIWSDTFDGPIEIWQLNGGQYQRVRSLGVTDYGSALFYWSRMSDDGRVLARTNKLVTWFDDGTSGGVILPIAERLWTDEPPTLDFRFRGGDINSSGVIAIKATPPGGTQGIALLVPTCRADVNADGSVDASDFDAWVAAYSAGSHRADQNGDGQISTADFASWIAGFNAGCDLP